MKDWYRKHFRNYFCCNTSSRGRAHFFTANHKEIVSDIIRRFVIKYLPAYNIGHISGPPSRPVVFSFAFNGNTKRPPSHWPFYPPWQFPCPVKRRNFTDVTTTFCPLNYPLFAFIRNKLAVPIKNPCGPNLPAFFTDRVKGVPIFWPFRTGYFLVYLSYFRSIVHYCFYAIVQET